MTILSLLVGVLTFLMVFICAFALVIALIYFRYRFYRWRQQRRFHREASAIIAMRGGSFTPDMGRELNNMLDESGISALKKKRRS